MPGLDTDVVVIGAGAAGLRAAATLSAAGARVLVLEARRRIGGRIHTIENSRAPVPIELGAEYIHGQPAAAWTLVRAARAAACDVPEARFRVKSGRLAKFELNEMKPVMVRLSRLGPRDMSFDEFLGRRCRGKSLAEARRAGTQFVEGFDAADARDVSARSIAEESEGLGDVESEPQFRLLRGYGALMDHLRASAERRGARFRLGVRATGVVWSAGRVRVLVRESGRAREFRAERAVITLPVGVLQSPRGVAFEPEVPRIRDAARRLGPGAVAKAILVFREPFWEELKEHGEIGFMHAPGRDFPTWWTQYPVRAPVVTAWAGGRAAIALATLGRREVIDRAVSTLARMLGRGRGAISRLLVAGYTHDWMSDPLTRGAYSYVRVNGVGARESLARPVAGTLFFAGEAADVSGQASTVAGALASGERAARAVLRRS